MPGMKQVTHKTADQQGADKRFDRTSGHLAINQGATLSNVAQVQSHADNMAGRRCWETVHRTDARGRSRPR